MIAALDLTTVARTAIAVPLQTLICFAPAPVAGGTRLYTTRGPLLVLEDINAVERMAFQAAAGGCLF